MARPSLRPVPAHSPRCVAKLRVLFDPHDAASIAAGIDEALRRSAELGALGLGQAAAFTWERAAAAHEDAYRAAAELARVS